MTLASFDSFSAFLSFDVILHLRNDIRSVHRSDMYGSWRFVEKVSRADEWCRSRDWRGECRHCDWLVRTHFRREKN